MEIVNHRFLNHRINPQTETLIIGTFNPETDKNNAEFFYGRSRNFLWKLLPTAFGEDSLKSELKEEKLTFINKYKIDFIDLISSVNVDEVANYKDSYLDKKVVKWTEVKAEIEKLAHLKRVCFTRKSFADVPNMKVKIEEIEILCKKININFQYLTTPARFYRNDKQQEWTSFFNPNY